MTAARRLGQLAAIAWAGSLWTVCGVVAPLLFRMIEDRSLAGRIAARLFHIETWIGVGAALVIVATQALVRRAADRTLTAWVALGAALPLASTLWLGPLMDAARAQSDAARFGLLHGIGAFAFGASCVVTLIVVLRVTRPAA